MTFCLGMKLQDGLVALADTQIVRGEERHSKGKLSLHDHQTQPLFIMTSGLRSVRDKTVIYTEEKLQVESCNRLYQVANIFGTQLRRVRQEDEAALSRGNLNFNMHAIIGGRLSGDSEPTLFYIYPEGNWIEATCDAPYFVIGRTPYAKPLLDRLLYSGMPLKGAAGLGFLAFDATKTSVTDVDFPLDMVVLRAPLLNRYFFWQRQKARIKAWSCRNTHVFLMTITRSLAFWLSPAGQGYRLSSPLLHFLRRLSAFPAKRA